MRSMKELSVNETDLAFSLVSLSIIVCQLIILRFLAVRQSLELHINVTTDDYIAKLSLIVKQLYYLPSLR